ESFGREYMGEVNGVQGYTPFLDSLAKKGLFFRNGIANGRRSIEGIPAVLSGIPALMNEPFVTSTFSNGDFPGLGKRLLAGGYQTSFFHGGNNGTMHFDSYTESSGILSYFGASEYPDAKDNDGVWGIYDGPMLQWMRTRLDETPSPFLASFFSLSSHNPYLIPDAVKDRYPEGPLPILKTIAYTDDMLREFFEQAEKSPWFQNTLFVITADHTFMPYLPQFDHEIGRYQVPILFYHPTMKWPDGIDQEQIVQQIDILPSVLDFLGVPWEKPNLLSRSVFVPGERTASVFVNGLSMLIAKDQFLVWPQDQQAKLYSMRDPERKTALEEPEAKRHLEQRLKAAQQYFSDSMLGNSWQ
ncbi:MAG: LTA synthase family protein, partial [Bdellovibrionaceae bacterium]|nr:LTA synthase family protein [Pseudobdellovibrionaceae bacterium]